MQSGVRWIESEYFRRELENCVRDSKQTYRFLDLISGVRKISEIISTVKDKKGDRIVNKAEIATAFNDYFVEIAEKILSRLPEVDEPPMRQIIPDFCIWLYATNEEVSKIITNLANKHSSGADAKSNVTLKSIAHAITGTLVKLINYSLVTWVFPEQIAVAKVIPFYKKGSKRS